MNAGMIAALELPRIRRRTGLDIRTPMQPVAAPADVTVYRTGTFEVAAEEIEGKCGVFGKKAFKYEAWFTATEHDLDERGFIVDNADLNRYWMRAYGKGSTNHFTSCERMCLTAVTDLRTMWPVAKKVVIRVWGMEDITYVEASWSRDAR